VCGYLLLVIVLWVDSMIVELQAEMMQSLNSLRQALPVLVLVSGLACDDLEPYDSSFNPVDGCAHDPMGLENSENI
jgi:hypothetical protein